MKSATHKTINKQTKQKQTNSKNKSKQKHFC